LLQLPPRVPRKHSSHEEATSRPEDSTLQELLDKTALKPPPEVNEKRNSQSVSPIGLKRHDVSAEFSFDYNPPLQAHCGPNPCKILQALTMSNANDGRKCILIYPAYCIRKLIHDLSSVSQQKIWNDWRQLAIPSSSMQLLPTCFALMKPFMRAS